MIFLDKICRLEQYIDHGAPSQIRQVWADVDLQNAKGRDVLKAVNGEPPAGTHLALIAICLFGGFFMLLIVTVLINR